MLIKGANPNLKDSKGKLPIDYTNEMVYTQLREEVRALLTNNYGGDFKDVLKSGAGQKASNRRTTIVVFYVLFFLMYFIKITTIFVFERINNDWIYGNVAVDSICLLLHILLSCRNPGFIKNDGLEFMKLLETFDAHSLCPDCEIIRTGRSRHCIVCNMCVDRYDHHCPWINNCVGLNNHNLFLCYLLA